MTIGVVFVAKLYGVDMTTARLATIVLTVVVTTFSVPGIPGGSIITMVPVLIAADLPVEGIGILLGADTIPDMFRTTANASADMVAAVAIGGKEGDAAPEVTAPAADSASLREAERDEARGYS
jgi:Na+/H+-dicarboxylate symporter